MQLYDQQVRTLMNVWHVPDLKKDFLLLGDLKAQGYKFSGADEGIKVTRGSMTILKGERTINLCKLTWSIIVGDASATTEKEILQDFGTCVLDTWASEVFKLYAKGVLYQYQILQTWSL